MGRAACWLARGERRERGGKPAQGVCLASFFSFFFKNSFLLFNYFSNKNYKHQHTNQTKINAAA
jgi:hypothetical protein